MAIDIGHFGSFPLSFTGRYDHCPRVASISPKERYRIVGSSQQLCEKLTDMLVGRRNEALESLRQLRGTDFNCELELRQLESSLSAEMKTVFHWSVLLQPWAFKPIAAAFGVMFFIGLSGINAASFNVVDIFRAAGSSIDGGVCAIILNTTQVVIIS